jgi:hypothetical protein
MTDAFDVGQLPQGRGDELFDGLIVSETDAGSQYVLTKHRIPEGSSLGFGVVRHSFNWKKDLARWDWRQGIFVFSRPAVVVGRGMPKHIPLRLRLPTRQVVYDVQFRRLDVEALGAQFKTRLAHSIKRRAARKHDWEAVLLDLVAASYAGALDDQFGRAFDEVGWQTQLERWIERHFDDRGLDCAPQTIREHAQQIMDAIAKIR